jgi:hypothetical protein
MDDLSRMAAAAQSLQLYRDFHGSGARFAEHMDEAVSLLVAGAKNRSKFDAPTIVEDFAQRVLEAAKNWDKASGQTYCGSMTPPKAAA